MDLTLHRQPPRAPRRHGASLLRGVAVPVGALGAAAVLSAALLYALSDLVDRLG